MSKTARNLLMVILIPLILFFVISNMFDDTNAIVGIIGYFVGFSWER